MRDLDYKYKEALNNILDCFNGADGGIAFVNLKAFMDSCVNSPNEAGDKLLLKFIEFSNLIKATQPD